MASITNGTVTYERRVKTGDFEHKMASAVIHYALDEGEDIVVADKLIARAGDLATQNVFGMLRAKPSAGGSVGGAATIEPVASSQGAPAAVATGDGQAQSGAGVAGVPEILAADAIEVDVVPPPAPVTNLRAAKRVVKARVNPEIISQTDVTVEDMGFLHPAMKVVELNPIPTTGSSVPSSELVVETSPTSSVTVDDFTVVISDRDLQNALARVNQKLDDRDRLLGIISTFTSDQTRSCLRIPQERRSEFLAHINALV